MPKNANMLICKICDFECYKQSNYDKHLLTRKHISTYNDLLEKDEKGNYICNCGKEYRFRQSLYTHKKTCQRNINEKINIHDSTENIVRDSSSNEIKTLTTLVLELVKSNTELQKQILEVCKINIQSSQPTTVNNNNNTLNANNTINATTNNNKTFNLNFFLNEQCKNAMNLKDFVDSMEVTLEDAERIGEEGYVEGMSSLFIRKINETDIFLRPIHCSDSKRDTLHIKRNDKWERDGPNNDQLTMALKYIEQKNMIAMDQFGEKYPDWRDSESASNDKYMNMILKLTDSGPEEYKKVTKKIIKEVVIDKENV